MHERALSESVCKQDREGIQLCPVLQTVIMGLEKRTVGSNGTSMTTEDALFSVREVGKESSPGPQVEVGQMLSPKDSSAGRPLWTTETPEVTADRRRQIRARRKRWSRIGNGVGGNGDFTNWPSSACSRQLRLSD